MQVLGVCAPAHLAYSVRGNVLLKSNVPLPLHSPSTGSYPVLLQAHFTLASSTCMHFSLQPPLPIEQFGAEIEIDRCHTGI